MLRRATSFELRSTSPQRVAERVASAVQRVADGSAVPGRHGCGALIFTCGALAERQREIAEALGACRLGVPCLIAGGTGVLSERGELEDQAAATGLVWRGTSARLSCVERAGAPPLAEALSELERSTDAYAATVVFVPPGAYTPSDLQELSTLSTGTHIFGGGAVGEPGVVGVDPNGALLTGRALCMSVGWRGRVPIGAAHSCRLLGPLQPITRRKGAMVLELGSEPALDVLQRYGRRLEGQPLVFTVLSPRPSSRDAGAGSSSPELLVRGVQGIDPDAKGLVVSDEVREELLMTFGVRDRRAAREDMLRVTRELLRDASGAAPAFGIYVNCSGRGRALHGKPNVDTRLLRERFGSIPIAGMQSTFEIAPHGGAPTFQLYTGVFSLFLNPS